MSAPTCHFCKCSVDIADADCPHCRHPLILHAKYRITRRLGQGGFGVVYEALDERLGRRCAIKRVPVASLSEQRQVEAEAQILAQYATRLSFIPQIYDIWSERGETFMVMEYIEGPTLDRITHQPWPLAEVLAFLRTMLSSLAQLHAAGIVHRDIKPANIKRTPDGRYILLDFGIAKDSMGTLSAARAAHSPAYASPEQVQAQPTDHRSDLYSLGATAYQALTGRRPATAAARLLNEETLQPPSSLRDDVPAALEETLLQMLALDPADRPETAGAARQLLEGGSFAHLRLAAARSRRWVRQRAAAALRAPNRRSGVPLLAVSMSLLVVALLLVAAFRTGAISQEPPSSAPPVGTDVPLAATPQEWTRLSAENIAALRLRLRWGLGNLSDLSWSPDGKYIAAASEIGTYLYDAATLEELRLLGSNAKCVAFSPDGQYLATGGSDNAIQIWSLANSALVRTLRGHSNPIIRLAFSPNGLLIASGSLDKEVRLWHVPTASTLHTLPGHTATIEDIAFSPDGSLVASASRDWTVRVWNVEGGTPVAPPLEHPQGVLGLAFTPDGRRLATGTWDGTVTLRDLPNLTVTQLYTETDHVQALGFSPDGSILAVGTWRQGISLRDPADGRLLGTLNDGMNVVHSLAFSPDGSRLVSASLDGALRLWNVSERRLADTWEGYIGNLESLAASPDGQLLAAGGFDGIVRIRRTTGDVLPMALKHGAPIRSVSFSPDGTLLATAGDDQTINIWRVADATLLGTLSGHEAAVNQIAFSPAGDLLASASSDGTLRLWQITQKLTLQRIAQPTGTDAVAQPPPLSSVVFSPNGKLLALGRGDGTVWLYNTQTGKPVRSIGKYPNAVNGLTFSPDQKLLAIASDKTIWLYDLQKQQVLRTLDGHTAPIFGVAFAPDGHLLVSAAQDSTVRIWQVEDNSLLKIIEGHTNAVRDVVFLPDGRGLASASWDGTVRVWGLAE